VGQSELNYLLDTARDETVKIYTKGEWRRKVEKVRNDEKSCREKHDTMAEEIDSLKRKLVESKEEGRKLKLKWDNHINIYIYIYKYICKEKDSIVQLL
jgi:predicted RNase H-like nuclease (RuvC/YqgF family)